MAIIVNMACGLANRMFQYAYSIYLKENGYNTQVDAYPRGKLVHETVLWNKIFINARLQQANRMPNW